MNILDEIAEYALERVADKKARIPFEEMRRLAEEKAGSLKEKDFPFEKALKKDHITFICECKKASPSKGLIAEDFPYLSIAKEYEAAGGDAISVLTEPKWFMGSEEYLKEIASEVKIPVLRKDFLIDPYMVYEAAAIGASAALLICALLTENELREYKAICDDLGLSALVEAHNEREVEKALNIGARVIGVNNRNLKDFTVDMENAARLRSMIPDDVIYVSESGIKEAADVRQAEKIGADSILIGETLMRAADKKAKLKELRG